MLLGLLGLPGVFPDSLDATASADTNFTARQGEATFEVTPLANGEKAEEFYGYSNAESHTTTHLERPGTSLLFLWKGPDGLSLVLIHGAPDDGEGGAASMHLDGLPSGSWIVKDDPGDWEESQSPPEQIDWSWNANHNDGGVYQGSFDDGTGLTIYPEFNQEADRDPLSEGSITEWQLLTGNASEPERIPLDREEPLEILGGDVPPRAPGNVRATGGPAPGEVTVEWRKPASEGDQPLLGYRVYRAPSANDAPKQIAEVDAGQTSYTDRPPREDDESTYWVAAYSAAGESPRAGPDCAIPAPNRPLQGCSPPGGEDIFHDDLEEGTPDWTPFFPWHEAVEGDSAYANPSTGRVSFWFGNEDTGTYEGTYKNGGHYDLVSPTIDLGATESPVVSFSTWYETEDPVANVDEKSVAVAQPGTNGHAVFKEVEITGEDGYRQWTTKVVDLSEFTDREIELRFRFTPSPTDNAYRGWYVDDVRVFEDHDQDGVSTGQERLDGTDPFDADTDDDGENDRQDDRPLTEDVPPSWGYWFGGPQVTGRPGEVLFFNEDGLAHVNVSAPRDNVGVGEVWFALELGGTADGEPVNGTMRFQLHQTAGDRYTATLPLPRNFEGGQSTFQKVVLAASDVNGNWVALPGVAHEELVFEHDWENRTRDGFAFLEGVDLPDGTTAESSSTVSQFVFRLPGSPEAVPSSKNPEALHGPTPDLLVPQPTGIPFRPPPVRSAFDSLVSGLEEKSAETLDPKAHGFLFGCDEAPNAECFAGDATASYMLLGDARDVTVGYIQDDRTDMALGAIGIGMEVNPIGDGLFATLKPPLKVIDDVSPSFRNALIKQADYVATSSKTPLKHSDNLKTLTYAVAKNIGDRPGMAKRLLTFDDAFPSSSRALLTLSDDAAVKAVDDLVAKYGDDFDTLAAKLAEDGSKISEPEDLVAIAKAEKHLVARGEGHFARTLLEDFANVRDVDGVKSVLHNMETAAPQSVKGYAFEAKMAAKLHDQGSSIDEMNKFRDVTFEDAEGVVRTARLDIDASEVTSDGRRLLNEVKSGKKINADERTKNQVLKLSKAVREDIRLDGARIVVSSESSVSGPLKSFARNHNVDVFDESLQLLNP